MASSRYTRSRESLATAASTAAISSGSGGSGMYSFAPAWMAATAARASVDVPHATTGTVMCSASIRVIRSRISTATSTISRSALRPERSTRSAISAPSAWVTVAPLSMASLVASVSWPRSVPTIRRRISGCPSRYSDAAVASRALRLDHFRHGHAEFVLDQHDFTARDQPVVDVDVDRLADLAVEFKHGAGAEAQQIADVHAGAAEHGRHLNRHVEHRFEIGGIARGVAAVRRERRLVDVRDHSGLLEIRERHFGIITHLHSPKSRGIRFARRHVSLARLADCGFGPGAVAREAAVGPFDAAIAERQTGLCEHDETAFEATQPCNLLKPRMRALVDGLADAYDDVRRGDQLTEARRRKRTDFGERFGGDQFRGELSGDRDRDLDRFSFEPCLDCGKPLCHRGDRFSDALAGGRRPALDLRVGGGKCIAVGFFLGPRERRLVGGCRDRALRTRPGMAGGEVVLEQELDGRASHMCLNRSVRRRRHSW